MVEYPRFPAFPLSGKMKTSVIITTPMPTLEEFADALGISRARQKQLLKLAGEHMAAKHPGFKAVKNSIAKREGVSSKAAGAILASATRKASPAAKSKNKNLKKVK